MAGCWPPVHQAQADPRHDGHGSERAVRGQRNLRGVRLPDMAAGAAAKLTAVTDVVGGYSAAAITFDDRAAAAEILVRLRAQPAIRGAAIYDATCRSWRRSIGAAALCAPLRESRRRRRLHVAGLTVTRPIVLQNETIGLACVESDFSELDRRFRGYSSCSAASWRCRRSSRCSCRPGCRRRSPTRSAAGGNRPRHLDGEDLRRSRGKASERRTRAPGRRLQRHARPDRAAGPGAAPARREPRGTSRRPHARARCREGSGRSGEPRQERVPGQHEPRDPHPDERRHRHDRARARHRPHAPSSATTSSMVKRSRRLAAARSSTTSSISPRSRPASSSSRASTSTCATLRRTTRAAAGAARATRKGWSWPAHDRARRARRLWSATRPAAAGARQPGRQRHQVHRRGRGRACASTSTPRTRAAGVRCTSPSATPASASRADKQRLIFEAFAQADGSTTRQYGGTGLGLADLAAAGRADGRPIWVESEPGEGSTFHFTAASAARAGAAARRCTSPPRCSRGMRVLVVDDNATNRRILAGACWPAGGCDADRRPSGAGAR